MKKNTLQIFGLSMLLFGFLGISCNGVEGTSKEMANQLNEVSKTETDLIREFLIEQYDLLYYEENAILLASERPTGPLVKSFVEDQLKEVVKNKEELKFFQKKYNINEQFVNSESTKSDVYKLSVTSNKDFDKMFLKLYGDFHKKKNAKLTSFDENIDRVDLNNWNSKVMSENNFLIDKVDSLYNVL